MAFQVRWLTVMWLDSTEVSGIPVRSQMICLSSSDPARQNHVWFVYAAAVYSIRVCVQAPPHPCRISIHSQRSTPLPLKIHWIKLLPRLARTPTMLSGFLDSTVAIIQSPETRALSLSTRKHFMHSIPPTGGVIMRSLEPE